MKYMEKGGFQNNPMMRLTLLWTCVLLVGFWVSNFYFYFSKMGLTPQSVIDFYCGSELRFLPPRSVQAMIEVTHMHLPMMALVMLLLTHLLIFAPFSNTAKATFISASFGSALLLEGSGWLVRFVSPHFAILKILSFLALQGMIAFLLGGLVLYLRRGASSPILIKRRTPGD